MVEGVLWGHIALFSLSLVLVGLGAAAETGFSHLTAARLRHLMQRGATRAQALAAVVRDPEGLLASVPLFKVAAVALGAGVAVHLAIQVGGLAPAVAVLAPALVLLLAAQSFGRGVATLRPEPVARALYGPMMVATLVVSWAAGIERLLVRVALRRTLGEAPEERLAGTEEELRVLVDAVEETDELEEEEREMITSIFEMSDRDVRGIMVPRLDVVALDGARRVAEGVDLAVDTGHSRLVVFDGDLDHVLGMVHLRDLAASARQGGSEQPVAPLARSLHVIPETKKIDELLHELQSLRTHMALVVDEYGGTAGVVTIEDLLEEIVGEIRDEYDIEEDLIQRISDGEAVMDARVSIHDANEVLPLNLDQERYDTIADLVYEILGRVPTPGDVVVLPNCTMRVVATKGRRVQRVHVAVTDQASGT